jgi:pSer/pThr/pTyr-binding forkhead associated (FHA) protein
MSNNRHQPKLIFVGEPFDGRVCKLELETTSAGRGSQNHLCIQDPSVSAKHCEILVHDSEVIVRDLKSSNGTFINAVRIDGQAQLKHGQTLRIGNVNARLELAPPDETRSKADATAVYQHARFSREARAERENPKPPPQPVKIDAGAGQPDTEHTVSLRKEKVEKPTTSPTVGSGQGATQTVLNKRLILALIIALAAVFWWFLRK